LPWADFDTRDWAWIALIALACLALRLPALDRIALNPDESQYEATASYLLGSGRSAFSLTYGVPGTMAVYKAAALVFGPYSMPVVRLGILGICLGISWMLYAIVRRSTAAWSAALGALLFVYMNILFEGHTANREWFAVLFLVLGILLCLESLRRPDRSAWLLMLLAGATSGVSLWFKLQASTLVLAIPLFLCWRGWCQRRWRDETIRILLYAAGGGIATGVYLACFFLAGGLAGYLEFIESFAGGYISQNEAANASASSTWNYWLQQYWLAVPGRGLWLVIYAFAATTAVIGIVRSWRRPWPSPPSPMEDTLALFVLYLVLSMFAVKMGHRFFPHYYLLMLPAVGVLYALAAHIVAGALPSERGQRLAASAVVLGVGVEAALKWNDASVPALLAHWPRSAPTLFYWILLAGLLFYAALRPVPRLPRVAAGLLALEALLLVVHVQRAPLPRSLPYHPSGYAHLVEELERRSQAGDRLFVWGWAPEIYSLSRLEAASHFTITQYIVQDYLGERGAPEIDDSYAEMLMRDLRERQPRFFVDASRRSWTMADDQIPRIYVLEQYPDFELVKWLRSEYRLVGRFDGTRLYLRRRSR
jgi:hypothetical protein